MSDTSIKIDHWQEQLDRIEAALARIEANQSTRLKPLPMESTVGTPITPAPPERCATIPGKVSLEVTITPDPVGLAKELTRILRRRTAPELIAALRSIE